jgi:hypothetical protein
MKNNFNYKDINNAIRAIDYAFGDFLEKHSTCIYSTVFDKETGKVTLMRTNGRNTKVFEAKPNPEDVAYPEIGLAIVMLRAMGIQTIPKCFEGRWIKAKELQIGEKFQSFNYYGKPIEHVANGLDKNGDVIYDDDKTINGLSIIRAEAFVMI